MDRDRILRRRLATQRLTSAPLLHAADVVRVLTCVQCQERDHAFFSLGLRARNATYGTIKSEHDAGAFVRTHILRPTWHFVAAEDLRWILAATSGRVEQGMKARHRQLGLDDGRVVGKAHDQLIEMLRDGNAMTRAEIGARFVALGAPIAPGEQVGHLLLLAELRGLICSGPTKGVHHSYVLVDETIPSAPQPSSDEALVELARRFFVGHGPASIKDFSRWSSSTITDTAAALREIGDGLATTEVDGTTLWFDERAPPRQTRNAPSTFLVPTYDEIVLSYPTLNFRAPGDHPNVHDPDPYWAMIIAGGWNVGTWRRTIRSDLVRVEARLAPSVGAGHRDAVEAAATRLAAFLGRRLDFAHGP